MKNTIDMNKIISLILRVGVLLSISAISAGLLLYLFLNLEFSLLIIKTGLLILFSIPFSRLIASLVLFIIEKDVIYFLITFVIILVIVISNLVTSIKF